MFLPLARVILERNSKSDAVPCYPAILDGNVLLHHLGYPEVFERGRGGFDGDFGCVFPGAWLVPTISMILYTLPSILSSPGML